MVRRCCRAYPALRKFVGHDSHFAVAPEVLLALKDHAVELTRTSILDELRCIKADDGTVDDVAQKTRRSKVQVRLKKLRQGNCSAIAALQCCNGMMATTPAETAAELRRYWAEVFPTRPCQGAILGR